MKNEKPMSKRKIPHFFELSLEGWERCPDFFFVPEFVGRWHNLHLLCMPISFPSELVANF
jgi:hypothetical protein